MKILLSCIIAVSCLFNVMIMPQIADAENTENVSKRQQNSYAKWSKIAIERTRQKYPNAQVIDYLHLGREQKQNNTIEWFRLRLRQNSREFNVIVHVEYNTQTENLVNVSIRELS